MALLFIDSFDHYQNADLVNKWTDGFVIPGLAGLGQGRCGTNCLGMGTFNGVNKGLVFGSMRAIIGHAFSILPVSIGAIPVGCFVGNTASQHVHVYQNLDGSLEVSGPSGLLGRTAPGIVHYSQWYFLEQDILVHPTAGHVILRLNNVEVLSVTGNTQQGEGVLRMVGFNCGSNQGYLIDDLYVLDDTGPAPLNGFLGDCHVEYLRPRAAGALQQWTPVGSTAHWVVVDDNATPDGDVTYLQANAAGLVDTNVYQPTGLPSGPVFGLQVSPYAKKTEIGPRVLAPVVNGIQGTAFAPSYPDYAYFTRPYGTNPATGLPWTIATINAVQAGVTVVS